MGNTGVALLRIASLYMLVSLALGMYMALTNDRVLVSVHSHIALLGWATMAVTGLVYLVVPGRAAHPLSRVHFWLHNAGLPVMMLSLALFEYGNAQAEPLIGLGSVLVLLSLVAFTITLFTALPGK